MSTAIDICARGLVMVGAAPITSFVDGTTEALVSANLYESTVQDHLSRYRWRFATGIEQIDRLVDAPASRWSAAYQLPTECLQPATVLVNDRAIDFDRYEDRIFCDAQADDEVYLEGVYRVDEARFPPWFAMLLQIQMASHFALSIAAKPDLADLLDKRALRHAALCRNLDAQARTSQDLPTKGLITGRMGRSRVGGR
ncbi:MAG: hypothetical protein LW689_06925 [Novosphingobium sp.]|jgi:hypothetical protein|nr:hypothetical protein [Novosphingobium sp.]MCE2842496.1 hypothetical protein [Novosphingobium sp.]